MASTHTLTAEVEVKFTPATLHDIEVEYPVLEITYSYIRGRPAYTPRGEYAPIDPPDPAEVDFRSARLIDGKGLLPTQEQIDDWARDYLDSDAGYMRAVNNADND
jgi:hypothetical protein